MSKMGGQIAAEVAFSVENSEQALKFTALFTWTEDHSLVHAEDIVLVA